MMSLREIIKNAWEQKKAILHINVADMAMFNAVATVAKKHETPIIMGVSEGERAFWGEKRIAALVQTARKEGIPLFLNADHTHSFEKIKIAVEAGFDAVLFDAGALPLEENIRETRHVVEFVSQYNYKNGTNVLVEAELGYIGAGSIILEEVPKDAAQRPEDLTSPQDALRFVQETGIDMLAPAVGTLHGMLAHSANPHIDLERIKAIQEIAHIPLVLHGGSGTPQEDVKKATHNGITILHISTQLRVAWKRALDMALLSNPKEIAPYKIFTDVSKTLEKTVEDILTMIEN